MFFKNLTIYRPRNDVKSMLLQSSELEESLKQKAFKPCHSEQRESIGWIPPLGRGTTSLHHMANGHLLLTMAHQERLLPASVVKEELDERVADIQEREGRKVGSKEKKELREQVEFELLPRVVTRTRKLGLAVSNDGWLVIDTSSFNKAELVVGLLRKTLGSFPAAAPDIQISSSTLLTHWLKEGNIPSCFELGEECKLISPDEDKSVVTFRKHELLAEEVKTNIDHGKLVTELQLIWANKIGFKLTETMQMKSLKFLDIFNDQLDEHDPQSHAEKMDIEFTLMMGELDMLLRDLMQVFNPSVSRDEATVATFGDGSKNND